MVVREIVECGIIKDSTEIWLRRWTDTLEVLAHGKWFEDSLLKYLDKKVDSFTWQDDGKVFIDIH